MHYKTKKIVANYVKDSPLLGANSYEKALVQQWVSFATSEVLGHAGKWLYPILGYATYNKEIEVKAKEDLKRALVALDAALLKKTFLVGERVTLADISVACSLCWPYQHILDPSYRSAFPNVNRWFLTVMNQPNVKKVVGEVKMCDKAAVYDAKKLQAAKPQEKKPAAEKKPAEKPAATADDDEDEGAKEEKKKNPLDLLPPSKFNLDAWKRFYSNNDTRPTAINWFWENYDAEGFSMWKVDYKYNDELGLIFQSSNLIGGFFQRLDRARKYGTPSCALYWFTFRSTSHRIILCDL